MPSVWFSGDGRLGSLLTQLVHSGDEAAGQLTLASGIEDAAVIVDYSHPDWTRPLVSRLRDAPRPLVVGTTNLGDDLIDELRQLAQRVPVVLAPNTGTGINVLRRLVVDAVAVLGPGWDVEVLELHHRRKVDAPSGTAWHLVDAAAGARGADRGVAVAERLGETGARTDAEIGVQALRGGDVVGEHTVYLIGHGERLELTHRAWDRATFARGGLRAARWLIAEGREPGLYGMDDVLAG